MSSGSRRRAGVAGVIAAASIASALAAVPARASDPPGYTSDCPAPESLVSGTTWHGHRLSAGVTLKEGRHSDRNGYVDMHVLTVDVTNRHVSLAPLAHRLAQRTPLSGLAAGHPSLVAATNTGYFDFLEGAPLGPLVDRQRPWITSSVSAPVVGLSTTGTMQAGQLRLTGTVTVGKAGRPLVGLNVLTPPAGLSAYSPMWGSTHVSLPRDAVSRYVVGGKVTSGAGQFDTAPTSGYLLVARGSTAVNWLSALHKGATVAVTTKVTSNTTHPFTLAYGVSSQIVHRGVAVTGTACRRRYPQPARTAIGFANHGQTLILAVVADDPGTPMHGLDGDQMARVMKDLGAGEAYMFDGSGSSEMLARMPSSPTTLSLRNYPADGAERPMPVGFGIFKR